MRYEECKAGYTLNNCQITPGHFSLTLMLHDVSAMQSMSTWLVPLLYVKNPTSEENITLTTLAVQWDFENLLLFWCLDMDSNFVAAAPWHREWRVVLHQAIGTVFHSIIHSICTQSIFKDVILVPH